MHRRGIEPVIPTRKNEQRDPAFDKAAYRERNKVERLINRLKQYRCIATRYEKRASNYLTMVNLAMIMLCDLAPWSALVLKLGSVDEETDDEEDGRRFRILVVVDDCTRECLALVVDTSLSGRRVTRELDRIIKDRGKPLMIVSDNGTELTSHAICAGRRSVRSSGTTSPQASRSRTVLSKA